MSIIEPLEKRSSLALDPVDFHCDFQLERLRRVQVPAFHCGQRKAPGTDPLGAKGALLEGRWRSGQKPPRDEPSGCS